MTNSSFHPRLELAALLVGAGVLWTNPGIAQEPQGDVAEASVTGATAAAPEEAPALPSDPADGSPGLREVEPSSSVLATPAPEALATVTSSSESGPFRRAVEQSARDAGRDRVLQSVVGLASGGALIGVGFAAEGPDMTWSHVLWISGGVAAAASIITLFTPSPLESLAREAGTKSDAEIRANWRQLADDAKRERRTGAIFGGLFGAGAIVLGTLVLEDEVGELSNDNRLILGTSLVSGGALGLTQSVVSWFQPSRLERDLELTEELVGPQVSFSVAPTPSGAAVGVFGTF